MAKITGRDGWVQYGDVTIAEMVEWTISGFRMGTIKKDSAFGDTVESYVADKIGQPGTISFRGNWDPNDPTGQKALKTVCAAGTGLTNLYLYANTSTFWRVGTGGTIIVTQADAVTLPRMGFGTVTFEGQVTDAAMEWIGTGS